MATKQLAHIESIPAEIRSYIIIANFPVFPSEDIHRNLNGLQLFKNRVHESFAATLNLALSSRILAVDVLHNLNRLKRFALSDGRPYENEYEQKLAVAHTVGRLDRISVYQLGPFFQYLDNEQFREHHYAALRASELKLVRRGFRMIVHEISGLERQIENHLQMLRLSTRLLQDR